MARIKRDDSSWKARGIVRRDFRHSADGPEVAPHHSARRRPGGCWVHGHEWVEHDPSPPRLTITAATPDGWAHYTSGMQGRSCSRCGQSIWHASGHSTRSVTGEDGLRRFECSCGSPARSFGLCPLDYTREAREHAGKPETGWVRARRYWGERPSALVPLRADTPRELVRDLRHWS